MSIRTGNASKLPPSGGTSNPSSAPGPAAPASAGASATAPPASPVPQNQIRPGLPYDRRLAAINAAQNPLLEAAQSLLRALSDLPSTLRSDLATTLNTMLKREVTTFQALCHAANIRHEHVVAASYSLCTALDEAAQGSSWGGPQSNRDAGPWANQQLTQHFHGDHQGGEKVFLLVGRLAANPQEHVDLLELSRRIGSTGRRILQPLCRLPRRP